MSDITERSEVKALMARGREKGFLTYDEVNDALPSDTSSDQIDDVMSMFGEHDIEVVDGAEKKMKLPDKPPEPEAKAEAEEEKDPDDDAGYGKSNDPVRMYLRKMGSVSLLTREGEVEIAKRIEEGEKEILAAVLSSSIAIREILELGERLRKGKIRVREIIKDAGDEQQAEPEEEESEEESLEAEAPAEVEEAVGDVAAAPVEGAEPERPKIPKEEERKVEHVLSHIDLIRKLEGDVASVKETLATKKLSEPKRKELRGEIKTIEGEMMEHLEAIQLNKKQIDRIVLRLKGFIKRVEEAERELDDCERATSVPVRELRRLLRESREDEAARKKLAKKLACARGGRRGARPDDADRVPQDAAGAGGGGGPGRRAPPHLPRDPRRRAHGGAREDRARRGEPAPRRLDREEVHEPRPAVPGPDPGGQHRPHEGGRQVRVQARLQVLDVRDVVDPPGDHARDRRPGAHDPHPGPHDRDDQQAHPHDRATSCRSSAASRRPRRSPRRWSCRSTRSARS